MLEDYVNLQSYARIVHVSQQELRTAFGEFVKDYKNDKY